MRESHVAWLAGARLCVLDDSEGVEFAEAWTGRLEAILVESPRETPVFFIGLGALELESTGPRTPARPRPAQPRTIEPTREILSK